MKTKTIVGLLVLIVVISINIYHVNCKNNVIQEGLQLVDILAFANDEDDFPDDPWEGEDSGGIKYSQRVTSNRYEYTYEPLFDDYYQKYKHPVTRVDCIGTGDVSCIPSESFGFPTYVGIVKGYGN